MWILTAEPFTCIIRIFSTCSPRSRTTCLRSWTRSFSHSVKELKSSPLPIFKDIFRFAQTNSELFQIFLGPNGDSAFVNRTKELVRRHCYNNWQMIFSPCDTSRFAYFYSFIISGWIGLLSDWLDTGMQESIDEMAQIAEQIVFSGIDFIKCEEA